MNISIFNDVNYWLVISIMIVLVILFIILTKVIFYYLDEIQIRRIIRAEIVNRKNNELIRKLNSRIIEKVKLAINWKAITGQPMADEIIEALTELERLQDKATPKKVIEIDPPPIRYYAYYCPNCESFLRYSDNSKKPNFCHHCGQALDWSDEK